MEEQVAVSEEQEQPEQEQVAKGPKYPRTMKQGRFAGRTFNTDAEYKAAMDELHANGLPKRTRRANRTVRRAKSVEPVDQRGTYRLQVDLNGQKIVAEGSVTQAQFSDLMRAVTPKS